MTAEYRNTNLIEQQSSGPRFASEERRRNDMEIPTADWAAFLDSFARQHQGWLVNITVTSGPEEHVKTTDYRLQNTALVQVGKRHYIRISAVAGQGRQVTHEIVDPARLIFKLDARGAHEGLDITAADHSITALRFRVAARPETLDGVLSDIRGANCKTSFMPSTSTP